MFRIAHAAMVMTCVVGLAGVATPASAQTMFPLTVNVGGNTPGTAAVIGAGGGLCATSASTTCTFQIPSGATITVAANAPSGQTPGRLSAGSGPAAACGLSTCTFTMTSAASVTATFTTGDGPVATVTTAAAGDGAGVVAADNSSCQKFDLSRASSCATSYLLGSSVALTASTVPGSRFSGYASGSGGAAACGAAPSCSFMLGGDAAVTATFNRLVSINVQPRSVTRQIGQTATFIAQGTYSNGVTEPIPSGTASWVTGASGDLIVPRYALAAARANGAVYALGGVASGAPSAIVEANTGSGWAAKAPMTTPREGLAATDLATEVYAIGGNTTGDTPVDTVERYRSATDVWELVAPLARPRRYLAAATVRGVTIYAVGGEVVVGGVPAVVGDVEAYTFNGSWTARASMPTPRKSLGVGVDTANQILYAIGGETADGTRVAAVEAYDPATDTWTTKASMPAARSGAAVVSDGRFLYVMGGTAPDGTVQASTYVYDTANDTWSTSADMTTPRTGAAAALWDTVLTIGGRGASGATLDSVESLEFPLAWGLSFASSGPPVAAISPSGVATALSYGSTTVFATAGSVWCTSFPVNSCGLLQVVTPPTDMSLDLPAPNATVSQPFQVAGWAINRGATTGPGVDAIHVYAFPSGGGSAIFLGVAQYGLPRSDIGSLYGSQFSNSGFILNVQTLPAGSYSITAYAHNAVSASFDAARTATVTVLTPVSNPFLTVDTPTSGSTLTSAFEVGGWAIDSGASSGTGIDAVRFFIIPSGSSSEIFVGTGSYGIARSDVGAVFGPRFTNSGYHFTVTGFGPGSYTLRVKAHSTVTQLYSVVTDVPIAVNATTLMSIDAPAPEAVITTSFGVAGWAIDRTASSGTGVDAVHVYAYPDPGSGQPPIFLGVARGGIGRPDVASAYGAQFEASGYSMNIDRSTLPNGVYDLVCWAHSSVTGSFTAYAVVRITLQ